MLTKNSEPIVGKQDQELLLDSVQNVFNSFIGKTLMPGNKKDKLNFSYREIGEWTFRDTHRSHFEKTTEDCIMILKNREATPCSVGLPQSDGQFPDNIHCSKVIRDLIIMHQKRSFCGFLYAVVTDLARIVTLRIQGSDYESLSITKSNVRSGDEVREVFEKFAAASAVELGRSFVYFLLF